jgi:hypothetical protein
LLPQELYGIDRAKERAARAKGPTNMKKLSAILIIAAAVAFSGCKKKDEGNKPATTEKPVTGTTTTTTTTGSAAPAGGSMAGAPAGTTTTTTTTTGGTMAGSAVVADPAGTAPVATGPAPTDAEFEAMMGKAVTMFTAMGAAADASAGDCGKLATSLEKVMADNKDFIEQAKKYKGNPDMDKKGEEWMKAHQDQVMGPMMKVAGAGQKCAGDAKFMAVMEKLGELGN